MTAQPDAVGVALTYLVPEAGIEPARPFYGRQILSLLCLPISPLGLDTKIRILTFSDHHPRKLGLFEPKIEG